MVLAYIGIGSSIDPEQNIRQALKLLAAQASLLQISTFYRTPAIGRPADPFFTNGIVKICTTATAAALKETLRAIEHRCGRMHTISRYAPRTMDLDLLLYDDLVTDSPGVRLPHPDIADRSFLAVPLAELDPDTKLPGTSRTMRDLAMRFSRHTMEPLLEYSAKLKKELQP